MKMVIAVRMKEEIIMQRSIHLMVSEVRDQLLYSKNINIYKCGLIV